MRLRRAERMKSSSISMSARIHDVWKLTLGLPRYALLIIPALLFAGANSHATTFFNDDNGQRVFMVDEDGDLHLKGVLSEVANLNAPPPMSNTWSLVDSANKTVLVLALEPISNYPTNGLDAGPGDLFLRGSAGIWRPGDPVPPDAIFQFFDNTTPAPELIALVDSSGNLWMKLTASQDAAQTLDDALALEAKLHFGADAFEIHHASIISPVFDYQPDDLAYIVNRGKAYDVLGGIYDPTNGTSYDHNKSISGFGDTTVMTWVRTSASGRDELVIASGDGAGMDYDVNVAKPRTFMKIPDGVTTHPQNTYPIDWLFDLDDRNPARPHWNGGASGVLRVSMNYFAGKPGTIANLRNREEDSPSNPSPLKNGNFETRSRFLQSPRARIPVKPSEAVIPGAMPGDPDITLDGLRVYDVGSLRIDENLNPSGLIHFGETDELYFACLNHNNQFPNAVADPDQGMLSSAPNELAYIFRSTDRGHSWDDLAADDNMILPDESFYNPSNFSNLPSGVIQKADLASKVVWDAFKFTAPAFVQYGRGYEDYALAFPESSGVEKFVYAISPHARWWVADEVYLARCKVYDGAWNTSTMMDRANWDYWIGLDDRGAPLWTTTQDVDLAVPIVRSPSNFGLVSVVYHKGADRYLMTSWTESDNFTLDGFEDLAVGSGLRAGDDKGPVGGRDDARWFLWEAPNPWGPWKLVFTNDYHGRGNDFDLDGTMKHGFVGYFTALAPAWMEDDPNGGWNIWLVQAGFKNFFEGLPGHPYEFVEPWTRSYTTEFLQVRLSASGAPLSSARSPLAGYEQNNAKVNNFAGTIGFHFEVNREISVTHLGRYYVTGNNGDHGLAISEVQASPGGVKRVGAFPVAAVTVDLDPALANPFDRARMDRHGFIYEALATPVTLSPGKQYVMVSNETLGGDFWYGGDNPDNTRPSPNMVNDWPEIDTGYSVQILNNAKALTKTEWTIATSNYLRRGSGPVIGNALGPVHFLYDTPPLLFHEGWTPGATATAGLAMMVGMEFGMAAGENVIVTHLGRYKVNPTDREQHELRLIELDPAGEDEPHPLLRTALAITVVDMNNVGDPDGFVYGELKNPVRLLAGRQYRLVSREFEFGDPYYESSLIAGGFDGDAGEDAVFENITSGSYSIVAGTPTAWTSGTPGDAKCWGPLNLKFE